MNIRTKADAWARARSLWATQTGPLKVGDRLAWTSIRTRQFIDRFVVGYRQITSIAAHGPDRWDIVVMGAGPTWDEAFARAATSRTFV